MSTTTDIAEQRRVRCLRRFADSRIGDIVRLEQFDAPAVAALITGTRTTGLSWVWAGDSRDATFTLWSDVVGIADGPVPS